MCGAYVLNRSPTKALWSKPSISHLYVFSYLAFTLVLEQHHKKTDDKDMKCIFVDYVLRAKVTSYLLHKARES